MNLKEIKDLIELVSEKGLAEFEIERQGFRLRINCFKETSALAPSPVATPLITPAPIPSPSALTTPAAERKLLKPETTASGGSSSAEHSTETAGAAGETLHTIKSPIVGTFYRAPSQDSEPFVKVGDHVDSETVVCIIEAMKLMNEIQAEANGQVVKVFIENGQPVEYGQPLFGIRV